MLRPPRWSPPFSALATVFVAGALSAVCGIGCAAAEPPPQLLDLLDFTPREVEVGDRLEVVGSGLPEGRPARVSFKGTLRRPGKEPIRSFEADADAASTSADRVQMVLTEALEEQFCGAGEQAEHTTFEGDVMVSFPAAIPGALPVTGTVRHVVVDFRPPAPRRAVLQAREAEGEKVLAFLGITKVAAPSMAGGLEVEQVRPGSGAEAAGIARGDVIVSFDGVRIFGKSDVSPSGSSRFALLGVHSPSATGEQVRSVSIEGYRPAAPVDLLLGGLVLSIAAAIVLFFMSPLSSLASWVEQRSLGRGQLGPRGRSACAHRGERRAGWAGRVAGGALSMLDEDIAAPAKDGVLVALAPYLVFLGVGSAFCVMPFGRHLVAADLDIGVLFLVGAISLATIALFSGGWNVNARWSLLGGAKAAALVLSYEVPGAMAIACAVMMTGSFRIQDIVRAQGGLPWEWFLFRSPVTFALFSIWFATALADSKGTRSRLPEADLQATQEERSPRRRGLGYLFFFFAEWANLLVMSCLGAALFLGGWQIPGVDPLAAESRFGLSCVGAAIFQCKSWMLVLLVASVRRAVPRVQIERMMRLCWKWLVPLSLGGLLLTAGWLFWNPLPLVQRFVAFGTFTLWVLFVGHLAYRATHGSRALSAPAHLNPFL